MDKLKFYKVSDEYINFLKKIDPTILNNTYENRKRPYVGVVLTFGIHQYFAPLSSYKPKYDNVKNHTIHKIIGKNNKKLAVIKFNCMFPIIQTEIELMDFEKEEKKYKDLLEEEYRAVLREQDKIRDKALKLYNAVKKGHTFYSKISCKFSLLEQEYLKFKK